MPVFSGSCTTNNTSAAYNITMVIKSFSLANKTGGSVNVTVGIKYGSTFDILYNHPLTASGSSGCDYSWSGGDILLPPYNQIFISVSGVTDFYFSIDPK
jgi:hypothetical protein